MIALGHLGCDRTRLVIRHNPVHGQGQAAGPDRALGRWRAWKRWGTEQAQSSKATLIARLMEQAGRMEGVVEVPHEKRRFLVLYQPLQRRDGSPGLLHARRLPGVGFLGVHRIGEMRRTDK